MFIFHTLGHLLGMKSPKSVPGAKGLSSDENYTRLHGWWFIYMDADIHEGGYKGLPEEKPTHLKHSYYGCHTLEIIAQISLLIECI